MLVGFGLGVLAASSNIFLYFWLYAWLAPLMLAGLCSLLSLLPRCRRLLEVAEGAFAAVVFAAVAVCVSFVGLAASWVDGPDIRLTALLQWDADECSRSRWAEDMWGDDDISG